MKGGSVGDMRLDPLGLGLYSRRAIGRDGQLKSKRSVIKGVLYCVLVLHAERSARYCRRARSLARSFITPSLSHSSFPPLLLTWACPYITPPPPLREFVLVHKKILTWESAIIILTNERGVV